MAEVDLESKAYANNLSMDHDLMGKGIQALSQPWTD